MHPQPGQWAAQALPSHRTTITLHHHHIAPNVIPEQRELSLQRWIGTRKLRRAVADHPLAAQSDRKCQHLVCQPMLPTQIQRTSRKAASPLHCPCPGSRYSRRPPASTLLIRTPATSPPLVIAKDINIYARLLHLQPANSTLLSRLPHPRAWPAHRAIRCPKYHCRRDGRLYHGAQPAAATRVRENRCREVRSLTWKRIIAGIRISPHGNHSNQLRGKLEARTISSIFHTALITITNTAKSISAAVQSIGPSPEELRYVIRPICKYIARKSPSAVQGAN